MDQKAKIEMGREQFATGVFKERRTVGTLLVIAILIRAMALWLVPAPPLPSNATLAYLGAAHMLVEGHGLSDPSYPLFTPPLYGVMIGAMLALFGLELLPIKIVQIFGDTASVAVLYLVMKHLFTTRVAVVSAGAWAIYPFAIYSTLYIGTETLFTLFLLMAVLFLLEGRRRQNWRYFGFAGLMLGLATMTRGTTQFLPFLLPFFWFVWPGAIQQRLKYALTCVVGFILMLLPWGVRNYVVVHDVIPVATAGGVFLWGASEQLLTIEDRAKVLPRFLQHVESKGLKRPPGDSKPTEKDRYMVRAAIELYKERLQDDPTGLLGFLVNKFSRLWYATESGKNHGVILGLNAPLYIMGSLGVLASWKSRSPAILLVLCIIGYFVLLHWIAFPLFRYMLPVIPFIIGFSSFAACSFVNWEGAMLEAWTGHFATDDNASRGEQD